MSSVSARDLRNHTAEVIRRASEGAPVTITVNGSAVAEVRAVSSRKPAFFSRAEAARLLPAAQADPALRADLELLAGDTTDDLGAP